MSHFALSTLRKLHQYTQETLCYWWKNNSHHSKVSGNAGWNTELTYESCSYLVFCMTSAIMAEKGRKCGMNGDGISFDNPDTITDKSFCRGRNRKVNASHLSQTCKHPVMFHFARTTVCTCACLEQDLIIVQGKMASKSIFWLVLLNTPWTVLT